jgi:hypothetical protein
MQRRTMGLVLLGIGAFAVAAALCVRSVLAPEFIVLPLDQTGSSVASGTGVTVFYPSDLTEHSNVTVRAGRDVIGDPDAPGTGPDVAVWTATSQVTDATGALISVTEDRVCLDRHTAQAVQCVSERLNGDNRVRHSGLAYTFPFDTEQRDYDFFDTTAGRAFPARFSGEEDIQGTRVYRFVQTVPETVIEQREVPGRLVGGTEGSDVPADRVYSNTRTIWVEPTTGIIVNGQEEVRQVLRAHDTGTEGVTLLEGTLAFDDATVAAGLARAADANSAISMLTLWLPILVGVVGVAALVGGSLLLRRGPTGPAPAVGRHSAAALRARSGS